MSILRKSRYLIRKVFSKNGLIITLLIGSLISLGSFKIEDLIRRQRYLELLQLETRMNYLTASNIAQQVSNQGLITNSDVFSTDVFKAGLESGYILTIPLYLQSEIYSVYTKYIPEINQIINHQSEVINQYTFAWEKCVLEQSFDQNLSCEKEKQILNLAEVTYSKMLADTAKEVEQNLKNLSDNFKPTQDRFKSPLLLLFMGSETLGIQK